ncbi:MAG: hypothetical protein ACFFHD_14470 [Promethearchaeota archaeon]
MICKKKNSIERPHRVGLWLSKEEKELFKWNADSEHFATLSQFIRTRCLDGITNSEIVNEFMKYIGLKIAENNAKYKLTSDKKIKFEDLKKPRDVIENISSEECKKNKNKQQKKHSITNERKEKEIRSLYVGFHVSYEEAKILKKNARKSGFKVVSKYIRDRCKRIQIPKYEVLLMIIEYISRSIYNFTNPDEKLEWKKAQVRKPSNLTLNLNLITSGLSEVHRLRFKETVSDLAEIYGKELQDELSSLLEKQRMRLDAALAEELQDDTIPSFSEMIKESEPSIA